MISPPILDWARSVLTFVRAACVYLGRSLKTPIEIVLQRAEIRVYILLAASNPRRACTWYTELRQDTRDQGARYVPAQVRAEPERGEIGHHLGGQNGKGLGRQDMDAPKNTREFFF